jgi:hypothetical protein
LNGLWETLTICGPMLNSRLEIGVRMTDKRADQFKNTNISPSTGRLYAARFDYQPKPQPTNTHDSCRESALSLPKPKMQVLDYWVRHALVNDIVRAGPYGKSIGGTYVADLIEPAAADTTVEPTLQQMKGLLLLGGDGLLPTFATAGNWNWLVPSQYVGIEDGSPQAATLANLISEL